MHNVRSCYAMQCERTYGMCCLSIAQMNRFDLLCNAYFMSQRKKLDLLCYAISALLICYFSMHNVRSCMQCNANAHVYSFHCTEDVRYFMQCNLKHKCYLFNTLRNEFVECIAMQQSAYLICYSIMHSV
jgi:hypothetical protein